MCAELNHSSLFQHADAVSVAHGGEAVGDQNGGYAARGGENSPEDFGFAAHVELSRRFIKQHQAGANITDPAWSPNGARLAVLETPPPPPAGWDDWGPAATATWNAAHRMKKSVH